MSDIVIIGLAGTFAAGKDTLAQYLVNTHGYFHVSTSDLVREDTQRLYGTTDRPVLFKHANELRASQGPGVLVDMSLARYRDVQSRFPAGVIVSGIRSTGEVDALKKAGGKLVFVDAGQRVRYERAFSRQRDDEAGMSFEDFVASEQKEFSKVHNNPSEQNILAVKAQADRILDNSSSPEELFQTYETHL